MSRSRMINDGDEAMGSKIGIADTEVRHLDNAETRHIDNAGAYHIDGTESDTEGEKKHRPMLRNANIDYSHGTFFVTIQAAFNKTIFGAIVGEMSVLNELGEAVAESLRSLGERYPGTEVVEFVVMPNHVHVILRLVRQRGNRKHQLGYVVGRFKSWIAKVYRDMVAAGRAVDVGTTPWQRDYWDKLVTTEEQLAAYRRYIRNNPAKWTRDRFGAVTSYSFGNVALLNVRFVGFVASQGAYKNELKPRLLWVRDSMPAMAGTEARHPELDAAARHPELGAAARTSELGAARTSELAAARHPERLWAAVRCPSDKVPVISTFTSAQERAVFAKVLASGRRFVKVCPGGIPPESELEPAIISACNEGQGLLISPVPTGSGVNKQRSVWCNEYVLKNAAEVWAGEITPGHTLDSLVKALRPRKSGSGAHQS